MSFHVKDDFKAGAPISQVPASWFNAVAKFLNGLVGGFGVKIDKNESGRSTASIDKQVLQQEIDNITNTLKVSKEMGESPLDKTDTEADDDTDGETWTWKSGGADDDTDGETWTWKSGGANGLKMDAYFCIVEEEGWHYFQRVRLDISKDGLIVKAEALDGRREIEA